MAKVFHIISFLEGYECPILESKNSWYAFSKHGEFLTLHLEIICSLIPIANKFPSDPFMTNIQVPFIEG